MDNQEQYTINKNYIILGVVNNMNTQTESKYVITKYVITKEERERDVELWTKAKNSKSNNIITLADMLTVLKYEKDIKNTLQTQAEYKKGVARIKQKFNRRCNRKIERLILEYNYLNNESFALCENLIRSLEIQINQL